MKFRTKGFIKTFCYRDLFIPGFTIKVKVYGPSLRSADYRRPRYRVYCIGYTVQGIGEAVRMSTERRSQRTCSSYSKTSNSRTCLLILLIKLVILQSKSKILRLVIYKGDYSEYEADNWKRYKFHQTHAKTKFKTQFKCNHDRFYEERIPNKVGYVHIAMTWSISYGQCYCLKIEKNLIISLQINEFQF